METGNREIKPKDEEHEGTNSPKKGEANSKVIIPKRKRWVDLRSDGAVKRRKRCQPLATRSQAMHGPSHMLCHCHRHILTSHTPNRLPHNNYVDTHLPAQSWQLRELQPLLRRSTDCLFCMTPRDDTIMTLC